MKKLVGLMAAFLLLGGCLFDFPVTKEHYIPIDLDSSSTIRDAIIAHTEDDKLFVEPMRFMPK